MPIQRGRRVRGELVGRDAESADLEALLGTHGLVTVAGPAGVGKSAPAASVLARRGKRRRVVEVRWPGAGGRGSRSGPAAEILTAVATGQPQRAVDVLTGLVQRRPAREVLLYLDEIDPVHGVCLRMVTQLRARLPSLRVLVTSRHPLGAGYERVLRLAPLRTYPGPDDDTLAPAGRLFLHHARTHRPELATDRSLLRTVAELSRTLDGLPLALEQAARQLATLDLTELLSLRLRHGQCWLTNPQAPLPRHRSLRQAIGAAYALCATPERVVWRRATAFAGGFPESAAAFLCAGGRVGPHQVPSCVAHLVAVGVQEQRGLASAEARRRAARAVAVSGAAAHGIHVVQGRWSEWVAKPWRWLP